MLSKFQIVHYCKDVGSSCSTTSSRRRIPYAQIYFWTKCFKSKIYQSYAQTKLRTRKKSELQVEKFCLQSTPACIFYLFRPRIKHYVISAIFFINILKPSQRSTTLNKLLKHLYTNRIPVSENITQLSLLFDLVEMQNFCKAVAILYFSQYRPHQM